LGRANLQDSATAEALRAICDLDLTELQAIEPPRDIWVPIMHRCPIGDPPPENEPSLPVRPGTEIESEDGTGPDDQSAF
jgi:hypothetical protein